MYANLSVILHIAYTYHHLFGSGKAKLNKFYETNTQTA